MADINGRLVELVTEVLGKHDRTNEILGGALSHLKSLASISPSGFPIWRGYID